MHDMDTIFQNSTAVPSAVYIVFFVFSFFLNFRLHLLLQNEPIMLGQGIFACPHCMRQMRSKRDMENHIRVHTGEKPFKCPYCPYASRQKKNYNKHIREKHLIYEKME